MSEAELDRLAAMVAEADARDGDADLEPEPPECDGDEAIEGEVPDYVRRFLAGPGQHEDDEPESPAERWVA